MRKLAYLFLALSPLSAFAQDFNRYVPPPAPPIKDGKPGFLAKEKIGNAYIIHIYKAGGSTHQFTGDYVVEMTRKDDPPFFVDLSTRSQPFAGPNEELLFITLPTDQEKDYILTVIDPLTFPWQRIFKGSVSDIPDLQ